MHIKLYITFLSKILVAHPATFWFPTEARKKKKKGTVILKFTVICKWDQTFCAVFILAWLWLDGKKCEGSDHFWQVVEWYNIPLLNFHCNDAPISGLCLFACIEFLGFLIQSYPKIERVQVEIDKWPPNSLSFITNNFRPSPWKVNLKGMFVQVMKFFERVILRF